jgi:hypothetical protein
MGSVATGYYQSHFEDKELCQLGVGVDSIQFLHESVNEGLLPLQATGSPASTKMFSVFHRGMAPRTRVGILPVITMDNIAKWEEIVHLLFHGNTMLVQTFQSSSACHPINTLEVMRVPHMFPAQVSFEDWGCSSLLEFSLVVPGDRP